MGEKKAPRVAVYCRVATESQLAMDNQKEQLTQRALSLGYDSIAHYGDNGESGLTLDRPGFRQMDNDIQVGKVNAVFVKDISRIGRDMWQTLRWIDRIKRMGVALVTPDGQCVLPPITMLENMYRATHKTQAQERK